MAELKWLVNSGNYYYFGDAPVHATGVSLDKSSISLTEVGQTEQLTATIIPTGALEQGVTWSSSDDSVATVSNTGLVTCITPGECTITVTTVYGGYTATCNVSILPYTPTENTLVYFPFISDADDYSGKNNILSSSGTQETIGRRFDTEVGFTNSINQLANFISFWMKIYRNGTGGTDNVAQLDIYPVTGYLAYVNYNGYYSSASNQDVIRFAYNSSRNEYDYKINSNIGVWYHIAMCYSNPGGAWCFVNGVKHQITTNTASFSPSLPASGQKFINNSSTTKMDVALSDVIAETTARSDADVIAYFNNNKSKYGL